MITQVKDFIREFKLTHGPFEKILDVGSLEVNGTIRDIFEGTPEYVGVDMRVGEGVDVVLNGHELTSKWPEPYFDLVVCVDTLEHDNLFWLTVEEMRKVLKPGGYLLISVPSFFHGRHDHPNDYYRFLEPVFYEFFLNGYEDVYTRTMVWSAGADNSKPDEVMGYGRKPI